MRFANRTSLGDLERAAVSTLCDHPGCTAPAGHRAPKARNQLNTFYWFCLDHIREYNRNWNYCSGLSDTQVESEIRNDTVWRRPSWPLGGQGSGFKANTRFRDDLGVFEAAASMKGGNERKNQSDSPKQDAEIRQALRIMNYEGPVTLTELKSRYKELVKRLHPDANGGDRAAEEKLKDINQAYATLKKFLVA
jgi:hypothetical protein